MTILLVMNLSFVWGAVAGPVAPVWWCANTGTSAQSSGGDIEELG